MCMQPRPPSSSVPHAPPAEGPFVKVPAAPAAKAPDTPRGQLPIKRMAFSQSNLAEQSQGPDGHWLLKALRIPPPTEARRQGYALTHGFHAYPGRFHPRLPQTLLMHKNPRGQIMCDPFMGGGTALVEAFLAGWQVIGNDMNPIARLVAKERLRLRSPKQSATLCNLARAMAGEVEELLIRSKGSGGGVPRYEKRSLAHLAPYHAPHLMAELAQWLRLIENLQLSAAKESLRAVLSSVVIKFSHLAAGGAAPHTIAKGKRKHTDAPQANIHYPKGAVTRHLVSTCQRLAQAQVALRRLAPPSTEAPRLLVEDARLLPSLNWGEVERVVSSPPYPGVYDYHHQHWLRMAWLGYASKPLHQKEITPKRTHGFASQQWRQDFGLVLSSLARAVAAGGDAFLVIGDWIKPSDTNRAPEGVNGAKALCTVAPAELWEVASIGSIRRRVFSTAERLAFGERGKWEHVVHFKRRHLSTASLEDAHLQALPAFQPPTGRPSQDVIQVWRQNGQHQGLEGPRHTNLEDVDPKTTATTALTQPAISAAGKKGHLKTRRDAKPFDRHAAEHGKGTWPQSRRPDRSKNYTSTPTTLAEEPPKTQFLPLAGSVLRSKSAKIVKRRDKVVE